MAIDFKQSTTAPNVVALQGMRAQGEDKFQVIFEVTPPNNGVYCRKNPSTGDIDIPAGTKVRFRTLGGPITEINIKIYRNGNYATEEYGSISKVTSEWSCEDATITATTATNWVKITPKNDNCTDLTVDLGKKKWCFTDMSGKWNPLANEDLPEPDPVTRVWVNGKLYEADETNTINISVDTVMSFRAELPDRATNILVSGTKIASTSAPTVPTWTTQAHASSYTFNERNTTKTTSVKTCTGTTANNYLNSVMGLLPAYDVNAYTKLATGSGVNSIGYPDAGYTTYVYLRAWNPKYYSSKATVLKFTRSSESAFTNITPEIDVDNLPEGCKWDAETKTYYYNKYSTDEEKTGIVKFKNIPFAKTIFYTRDRATAPSNTASACDGSPAVTPDAVELPINLELEPVNGQRTRFNVMVYDGVNTKTGKSKVFTFYAQYTGGEAAGATPTMQAPIVSPKEGSVVQTVAGGVYTFINNALQLQIESMAGDDKTEDFEYQFIEPDSKGTWAQKPDDTKWQKWTGEGPEVNSTGRLFVREVKENYESQTTYLDFNKISTVETDLALNNISDGQVITLKDLDQFILTGAFTTVKPNSGSGETTGTKFFYIVDKQGRAIKFVVEGNDDNAAVAEYLSSGSISTPHSLNNITGVIRGVESGLPELWITTSAMDYAPFLPALDDQTHFTAAKKVVTEMNRADFNRNVVMRRLTWNANENTFTTSAGAVVRPYGRLKTTPLLAEIIGTLKDGASYSVEGFVGYADGEMVLLPTGAVTTPRLLAPNPIVATEEDEANGYIAVNVISETIQVRPDLTGVREGTDLLYSINKGVNTPLPLFGDTDPVITITADNYNSDGICELTVTYTRSNIDSEPVMVRFKKHDAKAIGSIADFKALYGDNVTVPAPDSDQAKYYRYTGSAQVRAITPNYLYLRDLPEDGSEFGYSDLSAHSILLYNSNGWNADVAMTEKDAAEEVRPLKEGDIITNFALIADRTELNNLRGYATGFTRTLRRVAGTAHDYELQTKDILNENTPFTESDRMVRYTISNVKVKQTVVDPNETADDLKRNRYSLEMDGNPVLNIGGVFDIVDGWSTVYDKDALYNIEGLVLRNGSEGNYAIAMTAFSFAGKTALTAPVLAIEGADDSDSREFLTSAKVVMTAAEGASVYYTTDDSDPRNSATAVQYSAPVEIDATTVIKAYAAAKGEIPSEVTEVLFTRNANERRFIVNFLDQAQPGVPYHFSGTARVAAKGGEYIFVRGTQGHYLPMHIDNSELIAKINPGNYVSDFVMEAHIIGSDENATVRGAHVTADYAPLFSEPSASKPAGLDKDIEFEPDVVTVITPANARRFVKITGVRLIGSDFESGDGTASRDTEWKLTTEKGAGVDIPVNHNILKPSFNWDDTDQSAAAYYNITGFAMLNEEGQIELWPLEVEKVKSSEPVVPSFSGNITVAPVTADGLTTVEFYPYTTVSLRCPIADPESATIYYYVSANGNKPGENAKWNLYAQPFAVTADAMVTMYAEAPGYEQSAPTYIDMKLGKPAGTVKFSVDPLPGKTLVAMTADENAEIYYTTDANLAQDNWTRYTAAVPFTEATMLWAYAKEGNRKGEVSSMNVMVAEPAATPEDPDKVSGRVKVAIDTETSAEEVLITLSPEETVTGEWKIYYSLNSPNTLTVDNADGFVTADSAPIRYSKGGYLQAILVESGKAAGQLLSQFISFIPTDIDGIGADRTESEIRAEGGSIIAPEGSAVFDITGRRVNATGLRAGIYIVRTPAGKAVKVKID